MKLSGGGGGLLNRAAISSFVSFFLFTIGAMKVWGAVSRWSASKSFC